MIPRWVIVNYDIVAKNAERLHGIPWSGVILDEAHFIKNNSQRTSHCSNCWAYRTMRGQP